MLQKAANEYGKYYKDLMSSLQTEQPTVWQRCIKRFEEYYAANPHVAACTRKAAQYQIITDEFEPVIFPHTPFFFEMGMRHPWDWGAGDGLARYAMHRPGHHERDIFPEEVRLIERLNIWNGESLGKVWEIHGGFDMDHHCAGYTWIFQKGFRRIREEIAALPVQNDETRAMAEGISALIRVAEKFADKAEAMLASGTYDDAAAANLRLIACTGRRIPAEPPATLYEGLQMLLFVREVTASLDAIGLSVMGRPDKILYPLYKTEIENGSLTVDGAERLLAHWMLPHDIKTGVREREWPENSTTINLGGINEKGEEVWNELTGLIIKTHCKNNFLTPKLNCRCSGDSPAEYLELISSSLLQGHSNFTCINDDVLIPAQMRQGKKWHEAVNYVNGGCQETICEGVEHTAPAYFYFNMAESLHLFFVPPVVRSDAEKADMEYFLPDMGLCSRSTWLDFYNTLLESYRTLLSGAAKILQKIGGNQVNYHPCPLFSTMLKGCAEKAMDYTAGGAEYNPSGVALVGFADVVNSLFAIREICFRRKILTLEEMSACLAANWAGYENLRQQIMALPRFGGNSVELRELAARFSSDIAAVIRSLPNERNEYFQPSYFVYFAFKNFADRTSATPDGRRYGDILSQGIAPNRTGCTATATEVVNFLKEIDFKDIPGNAVLDLMLPLSTSWTRETVSAFIRSAMQSGIPTLQLNLVNREDLSDAKIHPENHTSLTVRISGLSAVFIKLHENVQDEIISRHFF